MLVHIGYGRAFVGCLTNEVTGSYPSYLVLHLHFQKHRFQSKPVKYEVEPEFNETFVIPFSSSEMTASLLLIDSPLHVVIMKHTIIDEEVLKSVENDAVLSQYIMHDTKAEVLCTQKVEWRRSLSKGMISLSVELSGVGQEGRLKVPTGVLDIRIDLAPTLNVGDYIPQMEVTRQLRHEITLEADAQRQFYQYARVWWEEYIQIHPSFKNRMVKIFTENEWSEHRLVCTFLYPMQGGRYIESPLHAARFVSLIPYNRKDNVGGAGRDETWHCPFTALTMHHLDCEDHCLLLASLLLGYGLDAYMCVGTIDDDSGGEKDHTWVMTRSGGNSNLKVTFWESLTGQRYEHSDNEERIYPYRRIGCVFNHTHFYANKHASDSKSFYYLIYLTFPRRLNIVNN